ncbi:MAG: hypothetical protein JWP01_1512 [Myxococcales bacterium]|nr:hypothetical protein [Myxococcales bacterium]
MPSASSLLRLRPRTEVRDRARIATGRSGDRAGHRQVEQRRRTREVNRADALAHHLDSRVRPPEACPLSCVQIGESNEDVPIFRKSVEHATRGTVRGVPVGRFGVMHLSALARDLRQQDLAHVDDDLVLGTVQREYAELTLLRTTGQLEHPAPRGVAATHHGTRLRGVRAAATEPQRLFRRRTIEEPVRELSVADERLLLGVSSGGENILRSQRGHLLPHRGEQLGIFELADSHVPDQIRRDVRGRDPLRRQQKREQRVGVDRDQRIECENVISGRVQLGQGGEHAMAVVDFDLAELCDRIEQFPEHGLAVEQLAQIVLVSRAVSRALLVNGYGSEHRPELLGDRRILRGVRHHRQAFVALREMNVIDPRPAVPGRERVQRCRELRIRDLTKLVGDYRERRGVDEPLEEAHVLRELPERLQNQREVLG